jgi:DNA adenine methylase
MEGTNTRVECARPLLKWAGGKPFLGSAAVFFDLNAHGLLEGRSAVLTDSNPDLIACYGAVRDQPEEVIDELSRLARGHERLGAAHYYEVRNTRFNPQRIARAPGSTSHITYTPALAAMFIYLNRTGYNGLFRLNADGAFNVPAGRYLKPRICDADNLQRVSAVLRRPGVTLEHRRFDTVTDEAGAGDFLYFDPPYAPLSRTARFTSYTAEGFDHTAQGQLRHVMVALARRGCYVVLSNSTAPEITELYGRDTEVAAAGLRCHTVPARRAINSNASRRGTVEEYVISNVRRV